MGGRGYRVWTAHWVVLLGKVQCLLLILAALGLAAFALFPLSGWGLLAAAAVGGVAAGYGALVRGFEAHRRGSWQLLVALQVAATAWSLVAWAAGAPTGLGFVVAAGVLALLLAADSREWVAPDVVPVSGAAAVSRWRAGAASAMINSGGGSWEAPMTSGWGQGPAGGPYGSAPYGSSPYGSSPYGSGGYPGGPYAPYGGPAWGPAPVEDVPPAGPRPRTVAVGLALWTLGLVLSLAGALWSLAHVDDRVAEARQRVGEGAGLTGSGFFHTVAVVGVVFSLVWLAAYAAFLALAWQGRNWARIVLWVIGGLEMFGVVGLFGAPPGQAALLAAQLVLTLAGIVLLAMRPSNEWFRRRGGELARARRR